MIYFDATKSAPAKHRSGLNRVATRLLETLGADARPIRWPDWPRTASANDWVLTSELFSEAERPGFGEYLRQRPCRCAAIFHDAIPLKFPQITWPQSVARHPEYMKRLASFDRVWAVSRASRDELLGFWSWQRVEAPPPVETLMLGADFDGQPRQLSPTLPEAVPSLLCVGILEPRKNQAFLLDVCDDLWREGLRFTLHLVGRVNPHFGDPIVRRVRQIASRVDGSLRYHEAIDDAGLAALHASARATVFPTLAEGCGLPLLESLWKGVPCVCSDLPVLRENADGGGCLAVAVNDRAAWADALRRVISDVGCATKLRAEAVARPLPTWAATAEVLRQGLIEPFAKR